MLLYFSGLTRSETEWELKKLEPLHLMSCYTKSDSSSSSGNTQKHWSYSYKKLYYCSGNSSVKKGSQWLSAATGLTQIFQFMFLILAYISFPFWRCLLPCTCLGICWQSSAKVTRSHSRGSFSLIYVLYNLKWPNVQSCKGTWCYRVQAH